MSTRYPVPVVFLPLRVVRDLSRNSLRSCSLGPHLTFSHFFFLFVVGFSLPHKVPLSPVATVDVHSTLDFLQETRIVVTPVVTGNTLDKKHLATPTSV